MILIRPSKYNVFPQGIKGALGVEQIPVTIILIDLDRFSEKTREEGLNPYKPNIYTGTLSRLVELFARKWRAQILYGLDWERGTEEALLQIPGTTPLELAHDLETIAKEMCSIGAPTTIVALTTPITINKPRNRKEAYTGPAREAARIASKLKRRGGGIVWIEGEITYRCTS